MGSPAWERAERREEPHLGLCSLAAAAWACSAPTDSKAMALTVSASSTSPAWASRRERPRPAANLCTQLQCLPVGAKGAGDQSGQKPLCVHAQPWCTFKAHPLGKV